MKIVVAAMGKRLQVILDIVKILFSLTQRKIKLFLKRVCQTQDIVQDFCRIFWQIEMRK